MVSQLRLGRLSVLAVLLAALLGAFTPSASAATDDQKDVVLYFYWGDGCPHCAAAKPIVEEWQAAYPTLEVRSGEVWNDQVAQAEFVAMADRHGFQAQYVPTFFLGDQHWTGWNDTIAAEVEAAVQQCAAEGCVDAATWEAGAEPAPTAAPTSPGELPTPSDTPAQEAEPTPGGEVIDVPIIGPVDLGSMSLPLMTLLIAAVDGFNPCSLWVLGILLALTLRTGSRRVTLIVGLVFITVTAFVYALFIAGIFSLVSISAIAPWLRVVAAVVAITFAFINIKDYFWFKRGVSLTIPESAKPGIYSRMRGVLAKTESLPALVGGTIALAAGVSVVELACTAGFPIVWTNILAQNGVGAAGFVLLLLLYMLVYQLDELLIFGAAVVTLRASKLQEKQGRILKLVGGILMLTLGIVMLVNPALMGSVGSSLAVFAIAIFAALTVHVIWEIVLPGMGLRARTAAAAAPAGKAPQKGGSASRGTSSQKKRT